jgi:hypothetical protein
MKALLPAAALSLLVLPNLATARAHRSRAVTRELERENPCPSTGRTNGAYPGYVRDHVEPLACGGAEAVSNQWQTTADESAKDKWERAVVPAPGERVQCRPYQCH